MNKKKILEQAFFQTALTALFMPMRKAQDPGVWELHCSNCDVFIGNYLSWKTTPMYAFMLCRKCYKLWRDQGRELP